MTAPDPLTGSTFLLHDQFQHLSHPPARRDNLPELDRVQKRVRNKGHGF